MVPKNHINGKQIPMVPKNPTSIIIILIPIVNTITNKIVFGKFNRMFNNVLNEQILKQKTRNDFQIKLMFFKVNDWIYLGPLVMMEKPWKFYLTL